MTTSGRNAEIDAIFDDALDVPDGERAAWLTARCGDDVSLRREVELLLAAHYNEGSPLDVPAGDHFAAILSDVPRVERIGPYRVLRELGRGGMGVVYLAERDDGQFRRRVAVKVLRASGDAGELHQRFLAERQILASLNHANIAQLLDGGVSDGQLPYIVIEYVDGLAITEYCDRQRLDVTARLRLFQDVCLAVHHAHQNLVLHRDLKPGNVLVTSTGQVKLLDFGIAKLLNPTLGGVEQPITRTAFRLMTPAYASPEQVRGDTLTTASDLYALGLLLYEMLTGRQAHRLTTDSPRGVFEAVCERDAERPSDAVLSASNPAELADARGTTPERLRRHLRGDLDAIVAMALRKEAGRRYGSAALLSEDIGRYLDGLPVFAHRGSGWYRFEKFVRRHRTAAAVTASSALLLIAAAVVAFRLAAVATRERDRGAAALTQTQRALRESDAVAAFLVGLFEASDPAEGGADSVTAADLLRRGVIEAERLDGEPAAQARMFEALGRVYARRGNLELATTLIGRALAVRRATFGNDDPNTAATMASLASVLVQQGKYGSADSLGREALRIRRVTLGQNHQDIAESLQQLSGIAVYRGDIAAAERYQVEAVAVRRLDTSGEEAGLVAALERLSAIVWRRGDHAGAERALREALAVTQRNLPAPNLERSGAMMRLASLLDERPSGRVEAESLLSGAVRESRLAYGDAHPATAEAIKQLGMMLASHGRRAQGAAMVRQALEMQRRTWGASHTAVAGTMAALARVLTLDGYTPEAEQLTRDAAAIVATSLGTHHTAYAGALGNHADVLALRGALDSAETLRRRALALRVGFPGPGHTITALTAVELADVLVRQRRFAEADSIYRSALAVLRQHTTEAHVDIRRAYASLANLYAAWGQPDSAAHYRRLATPSP